MTVHAASSADSPVDPSATAFVIARLLCVRGFAAARRPLMSAPRAGRRGINRRMVGLIIHTPPHPEAALGGEAVVRTVAPGFSRGIGREQISRARFSGRKRGVSPEVLSPAKAGSHLGRIAFPPVETGGYGSYG